MFHGKQSAVDAMLAGWEAAILESLGLTAETLPWAEAVGTLKKLSEYLATRTHGQVSGKYLPKGPAAALVWGLVYGARSYASASRLLARYGARPLAELGAGWGPFAFAAPGPVRLVDVGDTLGYAEALFAGRGASIVRQDARRFVPNPDEDLALAFSLSELFSVDDPDGAAKYLAGQLNGARRIFILEPGTRANGQFLAQVRDRLATFVWGPCPDVSACPYAEGRDWCHFTWEHPVGPVTEQLMAKAGLVSRQLHVSWLVLGPPRKRVGARVLAVRPEGHPKMVADLCTPDGPQRLVALRRNQAAFQALSDLSPEHGLAWPISAQLKGDGYRVDDPSAFEHPQDL